MELDHARATAKSEELVRVLSARLATTFNRPIDPSALNTFAAQVVESCCSITAPEIPEMVMDLVILGVGGGRGGRSRKPGNLALNMRKLVATAASGALAIAGMATHPWTAPLAALVLWDAIWSKMEVDIQELEASVLWAMWLNRDPERRISQEGLLVIVNNEREHHGRKPLTTEELDDALAMLKKLGCIEEDEPKWWLREWVQVKFD